MPKHNQLTEKEIAISRAYARLGSPTAVANELQVNRQTVYDTIKRPHVAEAIVIARSTLAGELLPLAIDSVKRSLQRHLNGDPEAAALIADARRHVFEHALPKQEGDQAKEPHEMTAEEIADAIQRLEREASERARSINPPNDDIFG